MSAATLPRSAGVLLHPTSLPGPYGIGDLGPTAYRWIETLAAMKQSWWQILPLGPTGFGDSPYQSYSAFAGNVLLLSPELLIRDGLLNPSDVEGRSFRDDRVDFEAVAPFKLELVRRAAARLNSTEEFDAYCQREASWLHDYALFMSLRDAFGGTPVIQWPDDVRTRKPAALAALESELADEIRIVKIGQFLFDRQWNQLKAYAHSRGVKLIGDAPIFVAGDSADVWANPDLFLLDAAGMPTAVAGVPPDYFAETGQLWGNPLYNWEAMEGTGFAWWIARLQRQLAQVDWIRLDHFRGFAAAWHVPATDTTALNGKWVDGPRAKLFHAIRRALGDLPIIAEDLGVITPDVDDLRTGFGLPGMRVLQFMLGDPINPYWPHNYEANTVVYTGTHDNDTTNGWYHTLDDSERRKLNDYLGHAIGQPHEEMIRLAWASVAALAIAPLQDLLGLGGDARMNVPGRAKGNWHWRLRPEQFPAGLIERTAYWTELYGRAPTQFEK